VEEPLDWDEDIPKEEGWNEGDQPVHELNNWNDNVQNDLQDEPLDQEEESQHKLNDVHGDAEQEHDGVVDPNEELEDW